MCLCNIFGWNSGVFNFYNRNEEEIEDVAEDHGEGYLRTYFVEYYNFNSPFISLEINTYEKFQQFQYSMQTWNIIREYIRTLEKSFHLRPSSYRKKSFTI